MKHDPFGLNLPKDSRTKQLEIISKDFFRPLFDPERFVVKEEVVDNGIDFRFEIKLNDRVTGFGFSFQLKSTETIKSKRDGSYSKSLETSNIEYLLNSGQPAFYGFYIDSLKALYYIDLKQIIAELNIKNPNWQDQENHTIRFSKKLDTDSVTEIFHVALIEGQMLRRIQSTLAESFMNRESEERIIIDIQSNVVTDSEISEKIERFGFLLIDACRWSDVIKLHQRSTAMPNRSAIYNLILGISFYYSGEYFRALEFFKEALKRVDSLTDYLRDYLMFFYFGVQRILNIISEQEYREATSLFSEESGVFWHRQLEEALALKVQTNDLTAYQGSAFEDKIDKIISDPSATDYIKLLAKIELCFFRSEKFICRLVVMLTMNGLDAVHAEFYNLNNEFQSLLDESRIVGSNFADHFCSIKHCIFVIHFDCIYRRKQKSTFLNGVSLELLKIIENTFLYFKTINHVENELFSLSVLLEYFQNLEDAERVREVEDRMDWYKVQYGNIDFNKKIDFTKNGGTFVSFIIDMVKKIEQNIEQVKILHREITEIDKLEKKEGYICSGDIHFISLFPLGVFKFPKDQLACVFQILRIGDEGFRKELTDKLAHFIPVINCLPIKIEKEGPLQGFAEDQGIESHINLHRIRKEMYESKFPKNDVKPH